MSGSFDPTSTAIATVVGAAYLLGTVLVVCFGLRERNSEAFTWVSVGFHALLVVPALALGPAWVLLAAGLTARAAALPRIARRRAGTPRPLKPAQVGAVEAVASVAVVVVAFLALP